MQNLGSLACSVWAVGGGGSKMLLHILYSEETCISIISVLKIQGLTFLKLQIHEYTTKTPVPNWLILVAFQGTEANFFNSA